MLCSWARHFTLKVPLSTQVYRWVSANLVLGVNLPCSELSYKPRGSKNTLSASCNRNLDMLWPDGPLGLYADFTYRPTDRPTDRLIQAIRVTVLFDYRIWRLAWSPVCYSIFTLKGKYGNSLFSFDIKMRNYWRKRCTHFLSITSHHSNGTSWWKHP